MTCASQLKISLPSKAICCALLPGDRAATGIHLRQLCQENTSHTQPEPLRPYIFHVLLGMRASIQPTVTHQSQGSGTRSNRQLIIPYQALRTTKANVPATRNHTKNATKSTLPFPYHPNNPNLPSCLLTYRGTTAKQPKTTCNPRETPQKSLKAIVRHDIHDTNQTCSNGTVTCR